MRTPSPSSGHLRRLATRVLLLAAVVLAASSCQPEVREVKAHNGLDRPIFITRDRSEIRPETDSTSVDVDDSASFEEDDGCLDHDLVASTAPGNEIERLPAGLCWDEDLGWWVDGR